MTALVFLHSPGQSPFDWQEVADFIPPTWAVAAPDLRACESLDQAYESITRDAHQVCHEPVYLVSSRLSAVLAAGYAAAFPTQVAGIIAVEPQWSLTLKQRLLMRKNLYVRTLGSARVDQPTELSTISAEDAQYPAQLAAAIYRAITGEQTAAQ